MRKSVLYATISSLVALIAWCGAVGVSQSFPTTVSREAPPIGTQTILFGDGQVTENRFAVRAFIATGSLSTRCLATLSESNNAVPGISVFCSAREFQGQRGIVFSAFFPQPIPAGLVLSATVYQEGALGYGSPVFFCTSDPNC